MRSIRLQLDCEPRAPRAARRALDELRGEMPPGVLAEAGLLVSELVTNCVRYAGGSPIEVRVDMDGHALRVEVRDNGPGIPAANARGVMPSPRSGAGRGLALVAAVAQDWGVGDGPGASVWFVMEVA